MNARKTLAAALITGTAILAPAVFAAPAHAATSSGCTITPLKPVFAGFNSSGVKLVDYKIAVNCLPGRTVSIDQQRYEEDTFWDDHLGSTSFTTSGIRTLSSVRTLVNTESGYEEVFQKVRFRVSSNGVTSPWTSYQKSAVLSILD